MPSIPSPRLLLELQATGENLSTWGEKLLALFLMLEAAIRGRQDVVVSGAASLASTNYAVDEATHIWLDLSGTGGTLTIPGREAVHIVRHSGSGDVTITTGAGDAAVIEVGSLTVVICDGVNVYQLGFSGASLKAYIDAQLLSASAGNLPGQTGNAGKFMTTDGTVASWAALAVAIANVTGFPAVGDGAGKLLSSDGSALVWLALATVSEIRTAAAKMFTAAGAFSANKSIELTDAATIAPPAGMNFHATLGASGRTIGQASNWTEGQSGRFALTTGGAWPINWHASYKKIGTFPSTFAAGGPHIFGYLYDNGVIELSYAGQRAA